MTEPRESLPIVAEFSARCGAVCRSEIVINDRQRKLSSLAAHAFASISFGPSFR